MDSLEWTVPENIQHTIVASSLQRTTTDPCHALQWMNASTNLAVKKSCESATFIPNINLTSVDGRAEMVTVSIGTTIGWITLNPQYWNRSIPILGRPTLSAGTIVFRAYPDDVTFILSDLHYQSFFTSGNDTIEIKIQYGNCTFDEQQQQQQRDATWYTNVSFRTPNCQILHHSFPIEIISDKYYNQQYGRWSAKFPWPMMFCLVGYPVLYVVVVHLELWYHRRSAMNNHHGGNETHDGSTVPPQLTERYIEHEDDNGMIYFEDTITGLTHWSIPAPPSTQEERRREII